jgi:hypothetical protein
MIIPRTIQVLVEEIKQIKIIIVPY